jgi:transposase
MKTVYIGLDLSRKSFYAYAVTAPKKCLFKGKYFMTRIDVDKMLADALEASGEEEIEIRCCFEVGTECHWLNIYLEDLGIFTHPFHALHFKQITASNQKTDRFDANKMADAFAADMLPRRIELPKGENEEARRLLCERGFWVGVRKAIGSRIKALARKKGIDYSGIGSMIYEGNRILIKERFPKDFVKDIARHLEAIELCNRHIAECEGQYDEHIGERYKELERKWDEIYGIGKIIAWMMVGFIGDGSRFPNGRSAASCFGLVPRVYQSGEYKHLGHITKAGPSYARTLLIEAANCMIRSSQFKKTRLYKWHADLVERRGKQRARVALARKILTIAVAMAKSGREFEPVMLES